LKPLNALRSGLIHASSSFQDLILNAKSKRYTYTKISRLLSQLFFSLDNYDFNELLQDDNLYARVLGFNNKGRNILKEMKKLSSIPIITKVPKNINNKLLQLDIQCTKAYSILNDKVNPLSDYLLSPVIK
ncbi:MAG: nucleotidyltransferase family protein, partial [Clostridium sp.]|uniref:nucleotidyltransferase family protein n=1 Tax=Clostridium sp. TaxID=1506 RepID=UPI0025B81339